MKKEQIYQKQYQISLFELFTTLPHFAAMLVSAFLSSSLLVWLEVIDSAIHVANIGFVTAISKKLTRNLKYEYNYGVDKIEALSVLLISSFELFSVLIILFLSFSDIASPTQPSGLLLLPILIKIINITFDSIVLVKQKKLQSYANTKIIQSEYATSVTGFMFGLVTFVSIFVCWVFRKYQIVWYFSPVMSILIALYITHHSVSCIRRAISELAEKTLPENEQMQILKCLSAFYSEYTELVSVNSLVRGDMNYIELRLKFAPDKTYAEIEDFKRRFSEALNEQMGNGKITITI